MKKDDQQTRLQRIAVAVWCSVFFLLVTVTQTLAGGKIFDEKGVQQRLAEHGMVRLIVMLNVNDFGALSQASESFQGGKSVPQSPDELLSAGISGAAMSVTQRLPAGSYRFDTAFSYVPGMVIEVNSEGLETLKADERVVSIEEDVPQRLIPVEPGEDDSSISPPALNTTTSLIGADTVWSRGITGAGAYVAILDTGVRKTHEMFKGKNFVEACYNTNYSYYSSVTSCPNGKESMTGAGAGMPPSYDPWGDGYHGTHVAGIAAGNNTSYSGTSEARRGVAYEADIIAINVFSRFNSTAVCGPYVPCYLSYTSDQIEGMEYVYSLRNSYIIGAVNLSLGGGKYGSYCDTADTWTKATKVILDKLRSARIATAIASGNENYCGSTSSPGCISTAITVGATTKSDSEAWFSNSDPVILDLLAPGASILSATSASDTSYATWDGTSMATPHVAGALTLFRSAYPDLSVSDMETTLESTGKSVATCTSGKPKPRIRLDAAIQKPDNEGISSTYILLLKTPTPP